MNPSIVTTFTTSIAWLAKKKAWDHTPLTAEYVNDELVLARTLNKPEPCWSNSSSAHVIHMPLIVTIPQNKLYMYSYAYLDFGCSKNNKEFSRYCPQAKHWIVGRGWRRIFPGMI